MKNRKGIGLLGLGCKSTVFYLQEIAKYMAEGNEDFPVKMLQAKLEKINSFLPNQFEGLEPLMYSYLNELKEMDIDCVLIPNITLHETIDRMKLDNVRFIHPLNEALKCLQKDKIKQAYVFSTVHTMKGSYISNFFKKYNIEILPPCDDDIQMIDNLRLNICQNGVDDEKCTLLRGLVNKYAKDTPVLIGCTELSLGVKEVDKPKIYDLAKLQLHGALLNKESA